MCFSQVLNIHSRWQMVKDNYGSESLEKGKRGPNIEDKVKINTTCDAEVEVSGTYATWQQGLLKRPAF